MGSVHRYEQRGTVCGGISGDLCAVSTDAFFFYNPFFWAKGRVMPICQQRGL
uniref:Uncharacterized protein n=1 Tax=Anguilla anguilla TaxID=7936 RepID=A0A0E9UH71_ANGAN